jgi:two-component system sensor histidine kinase/response regulator
LTEVLGATLAAVILAAIGFLAGRRLRRANEFTQATALANEQYRLLVDNSGDLIIRFDRKLARRYVSPASRTLLGYEPEEMVGTQAPAFVHPDDAGGLLALTKRVESGTADSAKRTLRLRRKDGHYIWVEANYRLIRKPGADYDILVVYRDVSDRIAAAEAIAASEARFRLIAENSNDAVLRLRLDGKMYYVSPAVHRLTGRTAEEYLAGPPLFSFIHRDDQPAVSERLAAVAAGAAPQSVAFRIEHKNGDMVWVEANGRVARRQNGELAEIICTLQNIGDRREAEEALRLSEERFRSAFDGAPHGMALVAPTGQWLKVNKAVCAIFGYSEAELLEHSFQAVTHPDDRAKDIAISRDLLNGKIDTLQTETRYLHKSGRVVWGSLSASPVRDDTGRVLYFVCQMIDITLIKAAAAEAARLAVIVSSSADAIIGASIDGMISSWNPAAERLFGWSAAEAVGRPVMMLTPVDRHRETKMMQDRLSAGERMIALDTVRLTKMGQLIDIALTVAPIFDVDGGVIGTAGIARDITERKQAAAALEAAKHGAELANRAKSEFLATMSHEIRTPMNGIIGMNALLLDTELSREQRRFATAVQHSADSLLTIINDILDVSKLEAGKVELESVDFNLGDIVDDAVELLSPRAAAKALDFAAYIDPPARQMLRGDPTRLRQIVMNLMSNALKFTDSGHVAVEVRTTEGSDGGQRVRIEVEDTGIGIDDADKPRLFGKFEQADGSITRRFGGTGLGLNICAQLVDLMGGEIAMRDRPGGGSIFSVVAPLARAATVRPPDASMSLAGRRILVVGDHLVTRSNFCRNLTDAGMTVTQAPPRGHALGAAIEAETFDVILVDCPAPDTSLTGLEQTISQSVSQRGAKLVLVTAAGLREQSADSAGPKFDAILQKPVRRSALLHCVARLCGGDIPIEANAYSPLSPTDGPGGHILLVEDNAINRAVVSGMLARFGYTVEIAVDGMEAVAKAECGGFDLILMDVQMPKLDGLGATKRIRALSGVAASAPIVAMTANAMHGDRERCLASGMNDYISKPLDTLVFRQTVARWVGASTQAPRRDAEQSDRPVLDEMQLDELEAILPPDRFAGLLSAYAENATTLSAELATLTAADDLTGLRQFSHNLVSTAGNVGARRLQGLAERLHEACVAGDKATCRHLAPAIEAASSEMSSWLLARTSTHRKDGTAA